MISLKGLRGLRWAERKVCRLFAPERVELLPDPELRDLINETGICFIHIPKTAGTSICQWLYSRPAGHRAWSYFQDLDPDSFPKWRKFAVIRDPESRFLSAWEHLRRGGNTIPDQVFSYRYIKPFSNIDSFAERLLEDGRFREKVQRYFHFHTQSRYVLSEGVIMVNFLVPFENISALPELFDRRNSLPKLNVTPNSKASLCSPSIREAVEQIYKNDFIVHEASMRSNKDLFGCKIIL